MKRIVWMIAAVLALSLMAGCEEPKDQIDSSTVSSSSSAENSSSSASGVGASWPKEMTEWNIPKPQGIKVTSSDNRSVVNGVLTQGVNVVVNFTGMTKQGFDSYCDQLESTGYEKSPDSLEDVLVVFSKSVSGGVIKITLSFTDSGGTIIANNSAAAQSKSSQTTTGSKWPESCSGIPEFTKGAYQETVSMGGNMVAVTYTGISDSDLDWYRGVLKKAGFVSQEEEDTEGYSKISSNHAYSVGFVITDNTLQLILAVGSY